jgi:hypothetical protein
MNMRLRAQLSVEEGEMAGGTDTQDRCRMHEPPHSHDDQERACGTGWVKAATITLQSESSP